MTEDLFAAAAADGALERAPLAERMRPQQLDEVVGQSHLLGEGHILQRMVAQGALRSLILWGPPGCGKTTLARLLAQACGLEMIALSAVLSGVKDIRSAIDQAEQSWNQYRRQSVLFVDEIHRFNKSQQDALLPHVESGTVILIGATTENPSFEVIAPLLSRTRVLTLEPLSEAALQSLITRVLQDPRGLPQVHLEPEAGQALLRGCGHDARRLLGALEVAADLAAHRVITQEVVAEALQSSWLAHDRDGESHYNITSAMIKSLRDSDVDAGLYWCMRLLEAGEDPLFVVRRLVILAAEDVGMADPRAIQVATAVKEAVAFVGMPEARIPIAMLCTYLGRAPKSNASYRAMHAALADVKEHGALPVPMVLRNAPTGLMKDLGYGADYAYAHDHPEAASAQQHRPAELEDHVYYQPGAKGFEGHFADAPAPAKTKPRSRS